MPIFQEFHHSEVYGNEKEKKGLFLIKPGCELSDSPMKFSENGKYLS